MLEHRFLPTTEQDRKEMLAACGIKNIEDLLNGIPKNLRFKNQLSITEGLSEMEIKRKLNLLFKNSRNKKNALSFIGAGVYDHFCPSVVNQLTLRGEFLTSYTPYQPEFSQGTLQSLFEFQSMIAEIFDMDVSNASHYDGATSMAEAVLMGLRIKKNRKRILISKGVHPEYVEVLKTYLTNLGVEVSLIPVDENGVTSNDSLRNMLDENVALAIVQSPNFFGCIENMKLLSNMVHSKEALFVSNITEPLSLSLFTAPGEYQADIAIGEGQSFGLPQSFGGPYLGLFTSRIDYVRQMPGRLCGETIDAQGKRSFTLTLSTREQHIRREKATSNICTNQNLCALWASIWLALVGKSGFVELGEQNLAKSEYAKTELLKTGKVKLRYPNSLSFNEFIIDLNLSSKEFISKCIELNFVPGVSLERFYPEDKNGLLVAVTEKKTRDEIDKLVDIFKKFG